MSQPSPNISKEMEKLSVVPKAPVIFRGKTGKGINVMSNYLRLDSRPDIGVYEYEVRFDPIIDMRNEKFKILQQLEPIIGKTKTFDGVKLYLPKQLEASTTTECQRIEDGGPVKVTLNLKKKLDYSDRQMIQQFNIIFKRIFNVLKFKMHNRNYYDPVSAHAIRQHNLSVWPGYVTAVDKYEGGLLLQCDLSHRVLRTETVRDLLLSLRKKGGDLKTEAEKALLGVSVLTRYNNMSYKIDDIAWDKSPKDTFVNARGERMSFAEYYKKQYQITIQDEQQPLLINRPRKKGMSEIEADRIICLVPELCLMTGLTDAMRADFKVMKDVAAITRVTPQARFEAIGKFIKRVKENPEAYKLLTDWGLQIADKPMSLQGRVLEPETLIFGRGKQERVNPKGDWNRAACSSVLTPVNLSKWVIIYWNKNEAAVKSFCKMMQGAAQKMGMTFGNPKVVALPDDRTDSYVKQLRSLLNPTVQLALMVVPQQKSDRYAAIKKLCCLEMPVPSQVVCLKTINNEKRLNAVAQKIALQINCKLGGELWACKTPFKHLMVVGIDVFHDKSRKSGSIAGIVASINDSLSRYYSNVAIQKQGQEIIDALKFTFMQALVRYYEANNAWPENIVVFRDGVGDGQLDVVAQHEGAQFVSTFNQISKGSGPSSDIQKKFSALLPKGYNPNFTYIVVQKRISTRVMLTSPGGGSVENPPPGTILDHTVTRHHYKDFFLVPQAVNQGTVTPVHLVVVHEHGKENLSADDVQKLAYKLTHMYFNWPGNVRVPAPCQYAHKLVDLVGEHLHQQPSQDLCDKLYYL